MIPSDIDAAQPLTGPSVTRMGHLQCNVFRANKQPHPNLLPSSVCGLSNHVARLLVASNDVEATGPVRDCSNAHLGGVLPDDLSCFTTDY